MRKDYDENLRWNLEDLFSREKDYDDACNQVLEDIKRFDSYKGHIISNSENLYNFITFYYDVLKRLERIYIYAHSLCDQDTRDTKAQDMYGKALRLFQEFSVATAFVSPEILLSDKSTITKLIDSDERLKPYRRAILEIFKYKPYTLGDKEESILSSLSSSLDTPDEVFSAISDADLKFGKIVNEEGKHVELSEKNYIKFLLNLNRGVRASAFKKLFTTYGNFKNTYAKLLSKEVEKNNKLAELRGYESALSASLFVDDIPKTIFTNLIDTVKKNVSPLSKYWKIKREILGLDELHIYDSFVPITKSCDKTYSEKDAKNLILNALSVLGDDYVSNLNKAFSERWIDFCPNEGKANGGYCTACYLTHPYILINYDGTLNSVSTLAHELGHAMHYYYAIKNQEYQDYEYSIFVAEVASQVNQILVSKYLLENTQDIEMKKYLIDDLIKDFKATIYRQTMFADFENTLHEYAKHGESLTHELIGEIYYKLNKEYQGENIKLDKLIKYEWARIPHFYSNFYVYKYVTAYAAAIKIACDILNKEEGALSSYLEFLKLGCTKTPLESLKVAHVDMSNPEVLNEAFEYFNDLVEELSELMEVK